MHDSLIYKLEHEGYMVEVYGKISRDVLVSFVISKNGYGKSSKAFKKISIDQFISQEIALAILERCALEELEAVQSEFAYEENKQKATQVLQLLSKQWS